MMNHCDAITPRGRPRGIAAACCAAAILSLASCEGLPGDKKEQGAVIGGVGGLAAGAALADEDDRLLGAVIGGVLGAGGGYLIGRQLDKGDEEEAAAERVDPQGGEITAADVQRATTGDIDGDGNVTVAELVAMERAGLTDEQILLRLEATDMVFELNNEQEQTLRDRGVSEMVVARLDTINRGGDSISAPPRQ